MIAQTRVPSMRAVVHAQLRLLVATMYVLAAVGLPLLGLLAVHVMRVDPSKDLIPWAIQPVIGNAFVIVVVVSLCAAYMVWYGEPPRRRRYHWSLPVRRELHDAMRVLAGAFWLCVGIAIFCVVGTMVEDPVLRSRWLGDAGVFYASLFLVPLMFYLLFSIPVIAFDRSPVWIGGVLLFFMLLTTRTAQQRVPEASDVYEALINPLNAYSLGAATMGSFSFFPWWDGRKQQIVAEKTIDEFVASRGVGPEARRLMKQRVMSGFVSQRESDRAIRARQQWIPSMAVWYVVALLGITLALRRRPDV